MDLTCARRGVKQETCVLLVVYCLILFTTFADTLSTRVRTDPSNETSFSSSKSLLLPSPTLGDSSTEKNIPLSIGSNLSALSSTTSISMSSHTTPRGLSVKKSTSLSRSLSPSSLTSTTSATTPSIDMETNHTIVYVLVSVAALAVLFALIFCSLYLRSSRFCSKCLNFSDSLSPEVFQFDNTHTSQTSFPIRARLSSIRRQVICKADPITLLDFEGHVKRLHADSDYQFSMEFESVGNKKFLNETDKQQELTTNEGSKNTNAKKNRYPDILPFDHTLVKLSEVDSKPESVYINASYVDSYRSPRGYIAAQGPLPETVTDFWRMVYENNTYVIVMVTNLFERMKMKCSQYWPDKASSKYGSFVVTIIEEKIFANYVVRNLRLSVASKKLGKEDKAREIQQFHFTEWPDHDVPVHPMSLLPFIRHSKLANPPDAGPIVVHCSAGVGRTGVYMVIDSMMERINDDKTVDVFNYLVHIRSQRMSLVQEERQYIFIHDCLLEYIKFGDTSIPIKEFHTRLATLRTVGPGHKKSLLRREFEDIDHTKNLEKHKWAGRKHYNLLKNRRKDILPVERTRVKLPLLLGVDGADYINASYIDGFMKKREFIATQAPMVETAECFYRMVSAVKGSHIVMLLDDEQWKKDDYADLPTEEEPVMCGRFEINLESKEIHGKFTVRKLRLFSSETSDGHIVTHYHYHDWPSGCIPKDKTALINFIEHVRESRMAESSDKPLIVICDYGVGPAGVFCLVSSLYDQIEHEQNVDVFLAAKLFRTQRPKLIETEELYSFCYDVMDQVITRKLISTTTESQSTCRSENISDEKNGSQLPSLNDVAFDMNV